MMLSGKLFSRNRNKWLTRSDTVVTFLPLKLIAPPYRIPDRFSWGLLAVVVIRRQHWQPSLPLIYKLVLSLHIFAIYLQWANLCKSISFVQCQIWFSSQLAWYFQISVNGPPGLGICDLPLSRRALFHLSLPASFFRFRVFHVYGSVMSFNGSFFRH